MASSTRMTGGVRKTYAGDLVTGEDLLEIN